jgi:hypothetical protein
MRQTAELEAQLQQLLERKALLDSDLKAHPKEPMRMYFRDKIARNDAAIEALKAEIEGAAQ